MLEFLEPPEPKTTVKWILCVDTIGDGARRSGFEAEYVDPDRDIREEHRAMVARLGQVIAQQATRHCAVQSVRQRDQIYQLERGAVHAQYLVLESTRDAKLEGVAPKAAATTEKKKKGKKKGAKAAKEEVASGEQDEDSQRIRLEQLATCRQEGALLETQVLALREHAALPPFAEAILDAILYVYLDVEVPKIDEEVLKRCLTPETVQGLFATWNPEKETKIRPHHLSYAR